MTNYRTITFFSVAVLVSLALTSCHAKDASQPMQSSPLALKLTPQAKPRASRSLSDYFEKVRSKIFGSRKQATSTNNQVAPTSSASVNAAQRQPWDINSFNQQYNPYQAISSNNYQWPSNTGSQYMNQQYNPLSGFVSSQSGSSGYPSLGASQSGSSSLISGLDGQQQQSQVAPAVNSNSASNGGLLSSASHLIAQYLSPSSSSSSAQVGAQSSAQPSQQIGQNQMQPNVQGQNLMTPQQQQQQTQYNEFASILDSMVAQTGVTAQRQPNMNQYMNSNPSVGQIQQQGMQPQQGYSSGNIMGSGPMVSGDNDMSGSSNIQSYMPAAGASASAQQASQKSGMVGLAEQLAPGAQFNKLVSFPFSLSNNDDPSKDGRYKLHIPFLNQHVKRSDQQQQASSSVSAAASSSSSNQQRQPQYTSYYNQQQYSAPSIGNQGQQQQPQQQMMAQASQLAPAIVSPQASVSSSQSQSVSVAQSSPSVSSAIAPSSAQSSSSSSSSSSVVASSSSITNPQSS